MSVAVADEPGVEVVSVQQDVAKPAPVAVYRVLTRFVLKYTLRAVHLELGGVEREVRRSGKP